MQLMIMDLDNKQEQEALMYAAASDRIGFKVFNGEYIVPGTYKAVVQGVKKYDDRTELTIELKKKEEQA